MESSVVISLIIIVFGFGVCLMFAFSGIRRIRREVERNRNELINLFCQLGRLPRYRQIDWRKEDPLFYESSQDHD